MFKIQSRNIFSGVIGLEEGTQILVDFDDEEIPC